VARKSGTENEDARLRGFTFLSRPSACL